MNRRSFIFAGPTGTSICQAGVRFAVKTPYYQTDTLFFILDKLKRKEIENLRPANNILMLNYFSLMNVMVW